MSPQFNKRSWSDFPLRELVDEVAQSLAPRCKEQAIEMVLDIPANLIVTADRRTDPPGGRTPHARRDRGNAQRRFALGDFCRRARRRGTRDRRQRANPVRRSPTPCLRFPGVTERGASGWEMAMVYHIARIHGGSVTAANCPEGGVALTLRIPRRAALEAAA